MDDFDRALMEALNETVPPAALSAGFADRLVMRRRRDKALWRLIITLVGVSGLCAAAFTVSTILPSEEESGIENGELRIENDGSDSGIENALTNVSQTNSQFSILNSQSSNGRAASPLAAAESPPSSTTLETQGEAKMKIGKFVASVKRTAATVLAATSLGATAGEPYQFIISGYPATNEKSVLRSAAIALDAGTYRVSGSPDEMDSRYRTRLVSVGTSLRSTRFCGMMIRVK